jgi:murein DD-endopeptidase
MERTVRVDRDNASQAVRRFALAALLCASYGSAAYAQERAAVLESVDLLVPVAPTSFKIAGRTQLVYELHITNFLPVDVSITRVQVRSAPPAGASIADYRDSEIGSRIGRPGLRRDQANPQVVGPGIRAVVYFWISLPESSVTPPAVRHRVELDILRQNSPVHAVVDGAFSNVSSESPIALDPPLRGGPWVAIYDPLLKGGHRTAMYAVGGRARIPARFAIDWIRLPAGGAMETAQSRRPADWNGYGAEVLAVADGVVSAAMDDIAENVPAPDGAAEPMALEKASGNYVALDLGRGRFAFYEHLKRGSVTVKVGERVKRGHVIGRLGNSGSSSIGPHLHFHVSDANSPLAAEGLPFVFNQFDRLGGFASIEALLNGETWVPDPEGRRNVRRLERPGANSVVRFPQ